MISKYFFSMTLSGLLLKDREYLPAPFFGKLAEIDPALIVSPPKGLEVGYVPIVSQQCLTKRSKARNRKVYISDFDSVFSAGCLYSSTLKLIV